MSVDGELDSAGTCDVLGIADATGSRFKRVTNDLQGLLLWNLEKQVDHELDQVVDNGEFGVDV
jgi:hypothetical protein